MKKKTFSEAELHVLLGTMEIRKKMLFGEHSGVTTDY